MNKHEWTLWKNKNRNNWPALIFFAKKNNLAADVANIVPAFAVEDCVQKEIAEGGWKRALCFLHGIVDNMDADYYKIDGYGNLTYADEKAWEIAADDVESDLEFELMNVAVFKVGDVYGHYSWFTGGYMQYTVDKIKDGRVYFKVTDNEVDGKWNRTEDYKLCEDEDGWQYVVLFTYQGDECRITARKEDENNE